MFVRWPWGPKGEARSWDLPKDGTMRLRPGREGVVLRAEGGVVLVTQEGDPEDHVLEGGGELRLRGGGLVAAWALAAARVVAHDGAAPAALPIAGGALAS